MKKIYNDLKISSFVNLILYLCIFFFFTIDFDTTLNKECNTEITVTFFLIGFSSIFFITILPNFLSLIKTYYVFIFIFFYFTAFKQYANGINLWKHIGFNEENYLRTNLIIIVSMFFVMTSYMVAKKKKKSVEKNKEYKFIICKRDYLIFILINIFSLIYCIINGSLVGRAAESNDSIISSIQKVIRFLPVATFLIIDNNKNIENDKLNNFFKLFNLIVIVILFFPLSGALPRFLLFGTYIIMIARRIENIKYKSLFPLILLVGMCFVFPAFNFFKSHDLKDISNFKITANSFNYASVDYDAHQMTIETLEYVNQNGTTFGRNILTSILFFIPRSIWKNKLNPSGYIVAKYFRAYFTNLSCPYIAEFYLAFGIFGVIICSILMGIILEKLDEYFFSNNVFKNSIASIILGMLIYWMRGAMLPTTAYTMALIISYLVCYFIVYRNNKEKKR